MTTPASVDGPPVRARLVRAWEVGLLAALTVLPLALGGRGSVNADTKQNLYLDPLELLERSRWVWDQRVGGGTVAHQSIGYLWPMGPYYALTDALGLPDWLAQRLWVGGLQLLAATGALLLFRHLLPRSWAQLPAAAMYGLSPFLLGQGTSQSGLLVPFAGLGWLVLVMVRAMEAPRSWRWPAAFALVVTTCGSLNGSSVFFQVLAATLWVPFAVAGQGRERRRDAVRVLMRAGALTLVTQLWWLLAYSVSGGYGLPVLDITENVRTTNATSSAFEVLRGLGYWTFYGDDTEGPWLAGLAPPYLTNPALLVITFTLPILALGASAVVAWRHRMYFVTLVGLGTVMAVGAFPTSDPSPLGGLFEALSRQSDLVLSLRNTQRAASIVALGLAGLTAAGLAALRRHHVRAGIGAAAVVGLLVMTALPAQWRSGLVAERFHRDEELPVAWLDAADALDEGDGRVLELPGIDFASYRWGHTSDPVSLGLTDRDLILRELVPTGGQSGADLLEALDRGLHEGWFESASLAPVARLLGASSVLVRNDLEYERYRTVRPQVSWPLLGDPATGLTGGHSFGVPYVNQAGPVRPMVDEIELGLPPTTEPMPQLAVFDVPDGARAALSTKPTSGAVVVDGDGEGIVAAAAAGLLDRDGPVLLGADLAIDPDHSLDLLDDDATIVLTDSNRKRARRWYSLRENAGATEPTDHEIVLDDPSDARLEIAGQPVPGSRTVVEWRGVDRIWATSYGNHATLVPEERPANAFDGDPSTAWRSERPADGSTRRLGIDVGVPIDAGALALVQPQNRLGTVAITRAEVILDGTRRIEVAIDPATAAAPTGTEVPLDGEPFQTVEVRILDTEPPSGPAGFAEVRIPGVTVDEVTVLPTALVDALGDRLLDHPLAIVLSRLRADPAQPLRADPEPSMVRSFSLPSALSLSLTGTARLDPAAPEPLLDALLGAGPDAWPVTASSSEHLEGSITSRASSALDGDQASAWQTPLSRVEGQWLEVTTDAPIALSTLALDVVADGRHSLPRTITLQVDDAAPVSLALPAITEGGPGTTARVEVALPGELEGRRWRLTVEAIDIRSTTDWTTLLPYTLPVGIAEVVLPGVPQRPVADVATGCRADLLQVDGEPVPVQISGSAEAAESRQGLEVAACSPAVELGAGTTELRTTPGPATGLALDRLVLQHAPTTGSATGPAPVAPVVEVTGERPGRVTGTIATDGEPFWLVLDESTNRGWSVDVEGATVDRQRPVDVHAAGWYVTPDGPGALAVVAEWEPQRGTTIGLALSLAGILVCVVLLARRDGAPVPAGATVDEARLHWNPPPPRWWAIPVAAGAAALLVTPAAAVPAAALVALARRWPGVGSWSPVVLVALATAHVAVRQVLEQFPATFPWPTRFDWSHGTALLGIVVLLAVGLSRSPRPDR